MALSACAAPKGRGPWQRAVIPRTIACIGPRVGCALVARVNTVAFDGISVTEVEVQVLVSSGLVAFTLVGLPDKAVAESRERVRAALHALGLSLPAKRITVNLAPADVLKEGRHSTACATYHTRKSLNPRSFLRPVAEYDIHRGAVR